MYCMVTIVSYPVGSVVGRSLIVVSGYKIMFRFVVGVGGFERDEKS